MRIYGFAGFKTKVRCFSLCRKNRFVLTLQDSPFDWLLWIDVSCQRCKRFPQCDVRHFGIMPGEKSNTNARCLKITEKVSFKHCERSELCLQKFIIKCPKWSILGNHLKAAILRSSSVTRQIVQKLVENAINPMFKSVIFILRNFYPFFARIVEKFGFF